MKTKTDKNDLKQKLIDFIKDEFTEKYIREVDENETEEWDIDPDDRIMLKGVEDSLVNISKILKKIGVKRSEDNYTCFRFDEYIYETNCCLSYWKDNEQEKIVFEVFR